MRETRETRESGRRKQTESLNRPRAKLPGFRGGFGAFLPCTPCMVNTVSKVSLPGR